MRPIILFRSELAFQYELRIVREYFDVIEQRCACPKDRMVIGRYSVLPFYQELERDIEIMGSRLVNTWEQHRWIANFDYYRDLKESTAESWATATSNENTTIIRSRGKPSPGCWAFDCGYTF